MPKSTYGRWGVPIPSRSWRHWIPIGMRTELPQSPAAEFLRCATGGEGRWLALDDARTRQGRGASTAGTSILEFAVVAPMVLLLLFAVFDFARLFYVEMNLQNAVREAGGMASSATIFPIRNTPA
jgi:hypothetical protein